MENENFEVNKGTCAIVPIDENHTKIIGEREYEVSAPVNEILDYSCKFFGSSLVGRLEASKFLLGACYKLPIILEEKNSIIMFPTHAYKNKNCCWISFNNVKAYFKFGYSVKVQFFNGKTIYLPISYESFETQIFRSTKLLLTLEKRVEKNRQ